MTNKQKRKLAKRAHIAAAIAVQNAWIEEVFFVSPGTRRERNALFDAARKLKEGAR